MAGLTQAQLSDIYKMTEKEPLTISQIVEKLRLIGKKAYLKIYNFFQTHKSTVHFLTKKEDGLLFVRANPRNPLILIQDKQIATKTKLDISQPRTTKPESEEMERLKTASPERWKAVHKLTRCNGFGYMDRNTGDFVYTNNIYFECIKLFQEYMTRTRMENIEMYHSMDGDPTFARSIYLPYKTRFNSQERQETIRNAYRATWQTASRRHLKGVFLTLTAPPRAGSLWDTNMAMLRAWGKLRRFLDSHLARGLTYLCVREFQQNGRLHFHIVIFGVNWLLPVHILRQIWTSYGGGPVMNISAIRQDPQGWTWARQAPIDAKGQAPQTYLSDYLEKSMSPKSGLNYWLYNIQFWTSSRDIQQAPERHTSKGIWARVGVIAKEGKRIFQKGNASKFFSGAFLRKKPEDLKPKEQKKKKEKIDLGFTRATDLSYQC